MITGGSVNISSNAALLGAGIYQCDATAGSFTVTLPPFAQWNGRTICLVRVDATANVVTWQTSSPSDMVVGLGTSGTLTAQGQEIEITAAITPTTAGRAVASTSGPGAGSSTTPPPPPAQPTLVVGADAGPRALEQPQQRTKTVVTATCTVAGGSTADRARVWLSQDNGATFADQGEFPFAPGSPVISFPAYVPTAAQTWKVRVSLGNVYGYSNPATAVTSAGFPMAAIGLPGSNLISALAINTRTGTTYNGVVLEYTADGTPYWGIPDGIQITCGASDPNGWYLTFTARVVDASGTPASTSDGGLESNHIEEFEYVPGAVYTSRNVDWWPFNSPTSTGVKMRFEFWAYRRPGASNADRALQTLPGGLTYLDVTFGTPPAGKLDISRADPTKTIPGTQVSNVPAPSSTGLAITATFVQYPATPAGIMQFGWSGVVTKPTDLSKYNGCHVTQQWDGQGDGGTVGDLDAATTTFANGPFTQPNAATGITFRVYPVNRDGVRGDPQSCHMSIPAAGTNTLKLNAADPATIGVGLTIKDNLLVNTTGALVNGDFEYGLTGWSYDGFVASTESYSGTGCAKQALNTVGGRRCFQIFNVIPGQTYLVTGYLKNEVAGTISLDCPVFTAGYTSLVADTNSGAPAVGVWQRMTTTVTIPATGAIMWVGVITGPGSGNVWADKITMELSDAIPAPTGTLGLTASFYQGTPTPSGEPQFGWNGTLTLPTDKTNYNGAHITFQWPGGNECTAGDLDATTTTFFNGIWSQPKTATTVTLKAYPVSVDNQRGTAAVYTLSIPAAPTGTTNLANADTATLGAGIALRNGTIASTIAGSLLNGGFEDGLTGWTLQQYSPAIDNTVYLSGSKSLKLTSNAQCVAQTVAAQKGETWKIAWATRNELVGTTAKVLYAFLDRDGNWLSYEWRTEAPLHTAGAGVWDTFSIATTVAPDSTATLLVYSPVVQGTVTSGACWVDSIAAAVVEDLGSGLTRNADGSVKFGTTNTANLLMNWNFADGVAHWDRQWSGGFPDVVATGGVAGSQYLSFVPGIRHVLTQTVDVRPNQSYYFEVSTWASSDFAADVAGIYVRFQAADGTILQDSALGNWGTTYAGWTANGITPVAPATAATAGIVFDLNVTAGQLKVDNVIFQNAPSTGNGTTADGKGGVQINAGDGVAIVAGKVQAALADGLTIVSGKVAPNLGGGLRINPTTKLIEASNVDVTAFAGTVRPVSIFTGANPTLPDTNYPAGSFGFRTTAPVGLVRVNAAGTAWVAGVTSTDTDSSIVSTSYLTANYATVGTIAAAYASFSYLSSNYTTTSGLAATYATIANLNNTNAVIANLSGTYATFYYLSANYATISALNAKTLTVGQITGWDGASIYIGSGLDFSGSYGYVRIGNSGTAATIYTTGTIRMRGLTADVSGYAYPGLSRTVDVALAGSGTARLTFTLGLLTGYSTLS